MAVITTGKNTLDQIQERLLHQHRQILQLVTKIKTQREQIKHLTKDLSRSRASRVFWEGQATTASSEANYYRTELSKAHALLGRVVHQLSERWDTANLTKHFPTDNLSGRRAPGNPLGKHPVKGREHTQ